MSSVPSTFVISPRIHRVCAWKCASLHACLFSLTSCVSHDAVNLWNLFSHLGLEVSCPSITPNHGFAFPRVALGNDRFDFRFTSSRMLLRRILRLFERLSSIFALDYAHFRPFASRTFFPPSAAVRALRTTPPALLDAPFHLHRTSRTFLHLPDARGASFDARNGATCVLVAASMSSVDHVHRTHVGEHESNPSHVGGSDGDAFSFPSETPAGLNRTLEREVLERTLVRGRLRDEIFRMGRWECDGLVGIQTVLDMKVFMSSWMPEQETKVTGKGEKTTPCAEKGKR